MSDGELPEQAPGARGPLSRAPERTLRRLLETVTLIGPIRSIFGVVSALLLGYRQTGELAVIGDDLLLTREVRVFGARLRRSIHRYRLEAIRELTLRSGKSDLEFFAGLVPLTLGTVLGVSLMARGALTPEGAPALFGIGALIIVLGAFVDALKAGLVRRAAPVLPRAQLLVRPEAEPGFVLVLPEPEARSLLLQAAQDPATQEAILAQLAALPTATAAPQDPQEQGSPEQSLPVDPPPRASEPPSA